MGDEGFEFPPQNTGNLHDSDDCGAESGAHDADSIALAIVIDAWPRLPAGVKSAIQRLIQKSDS